MGIVKMVVGLVILAAIVGGAMMYFGMFKTDASGNVTVDTSNINQAAADAQKATTEGYPAANAAWLQSKYEDAIRLYKDALEKDPKNAQAFEAKFRIAKCYEELNRPTDAIAAYNDYLASGDKDTERIATANRRVGMLSGTGVK